MKNPGKKTGIIFDIKRYAIHDGPGIRTTVFFKGCPLKCRWCHNPEGQSMEPELGFRESRCIEGCDLCLRECPKGALSRGNHEIAIDREACDLCGDCAEVCPSEALEIIGREKSAEQVLWEIEKDVIFYDESYGGVTFSGGEPLLQPEFLHTILQGCRERGIRTAVDTSGYTSFDVFEKIDDKVELFLYDLKIMDDKEHRVYTGVSNRLILENLKKLSERGARIIIRIPIIPGVNDSRARITHTADFITSLKRIQSISLLPYHKTGKQKYKRLNTPYLMENTALPAREKLKEIKKQLEDAGFQVKTGD